jgi:multiple antibiotic resistance protein
MPDILKILPNAVIPLFIATNIFVVLPIFISLTEDMSRPRRNVVIRESILTALIVSLLFMALGEAIFRIVGITTDDFKIGGGLVLLVFAILDLVKQGGEPRSSSDKMGVVPIGVPLVVGPAVLTTILVLVDHFGVIPAVIGLVLNLFIVWISFINAHRIVGIFGRGGILAISKVMAILLASIAVMMIRIGIENIIKMNIKG